MVLVFYNSHYLSGNPKYTFFSFGRTFKGLWWFIPLRSKVLLHCTLSITSGLYSFLFGSICQNRFHRLVIPCDNYIKSGKLFWYPLTVMGICSTQVYRLSQQKLLTTALFSFLNNPPPFFPFVCIFGKLCYEEVIITSNSSDSFWISHTFLLNLWHKRLSSIKQLNANCLLNYSFVSLLRQMLS